MAYSCADGTAHSLCCVCIREHNSVHSTLMHSLTFGNAGILAVVVGCVNLMQSVVSKEGTVAATDSLHTCTTAVVCSSLDEGRHSAVHGRPARIAGILLSLGSFICLAIAEQRSAFRPCLHSGQMRARYTLPSVIHCVDCQAARMAAYCSCRQLQLDYTVQSACPQCHVCACCCFVVTHPRKVPSQMGSL